WAGRVRRQVALFGRGRARTAEADEEHSRHPRARHSAKVACSSYAAQSAGVGDKRAAMTKKKLNAIDRSFLASERRDVMMHVGMLLEMSRTKRSTDLAAELRDEVTRS